MNLGPLRTVLGRSQGLCWRSWAALGASVAGLGQLSGHLWRILGRYRGLCGRSWAALRASVGGLGPQSGRKEAQTQAGKGSKRHKPP